MFKLINCDTCFYSGDGELTDSDGKPIEDHPCDSCGGIVPENWMPKIKVKNEDYIEDWEEDNENK